ncbi:MAG: glycine cleavage system protein GcvH [Novosphingobium sp.]|jgi:glycine cleavage system H protein
MTRYFTKEHEWVEVTGTAAKVGITDYAQSQLGDITFVELPAEGTTLKQGDSCCVVDSVKAASDVYAPVSGTVTAINPALADEPELVNTGADEAGWLWTMDLASADELSSLMDEAAYQAYVAGL